MIEFFPGCDTKRFNGVRKKVCFLHKTSAILCLFVLPVLRKKFMNRIVYLFSFTRGRVPKRDIILVDGRFLKLICRVILKICLVLNLKRRLQQKICLFLNLK